MKELFLLMILSLGIVNLAQAECLGLMEVHQDEHLYRVDMKTYDYRRVIRMLSEEENFERKTITSREDITFYFDLIRSIYVSKYGYEKANKIFLRFDSRINKEKYESFIAANSEFEGAEEFYLTNSYAVVVDEDFITIFKESIFRNIDISNDEFLNLLNEKNESLQLCHGNFHALALTDLGRRYLANHGYQSYDEVVANRLNDPESLKWFSKGSLTEPETEFVYGWPMSPKRIKEVLLEGVTLK